MINFFKALPPEIIKLIYYHYIDLMIPSWQRKHQQTYSNILKELSLVTGHIKGFLTHLSIIEEGYGDYIIRYKGTWFIGATIDDITFIGCKVTEECEVAETEGEFLKSEIGVIQLPNNWKHL